MKTLLTKPHPDIVAGVLIIVASVYLLFRAGTMPAMTALLPFAMLGSLIVLAVILIARTLIRERDEERPAVFASLPRFLGVSLAIALYIAAIANLGFYTSTAVMIPSVAWSFGYREPIPLALATAIFVGGIAFIFHVLMGQNLPAEFFAR